MTNGDRINIAIDFDADASVAYVITVTLAGSLQDGTFTNENQYSTDWDGEVIYKVRQTSDAWFVEVLLPRTLASMKNSDASTRTIAVAFDRVIEENQERSAFPGITFTRPRYVSEFTKIEVPQFSRSLFDAFPYTVAARDFVDQRTRTKVGTDILWKPLASFQLTAALNPDFGQVEADELVINFDAVEALFSDKRPFFTENQGLFDVRVPIADLRAVETDRLLYTRRIGGTRDDDPTLAAEIDGAVKVNASAGKLDIGVLAAVEDGYEDEIGRLFAAQRLRYSTSTWNLGYLGTWVDRPFFDRDAQVHAADFIWRPAADWMLQGQIIQSLIDAEHDQTSGDGEALLAIYTPSAEWQHELALTHYSDTLDFNDLGYQQRADLNRGSYVITRRFNAFGTDDPRAAVIWRARPELRWNDSGERLGHYLGLFRESQHRTGSIAKTSIEVTGPGVDDLITRGNGNVNINARLTRLSQSIQSARLGKWRAFAAASVLQEGDDDVALDADVEVEHFTRDDLGWSLRVAKRWSRDWLIWQQDDLLASFRRTRMLVASDINWFPTANQELRIKVQWLAIDARQPTALRTDAAGDLVVSEDLVLPFHVNNFGVQIRYRWTFGPQSDLYVIHGRGGIVTEVGSERSGLGRLFDAAAELRDSDQFIVKARHRFRF